MHDDQDDLGDPFTVRKAQDGDELLNGTPDQSKYYDDENEGRPSEAPMNNNTSPRIESKGGDGIGTEQVQS